MMPDAEELHLLRFVAVGQPLLPEVPETDSLMRWRRAI